MRVKEGQLINGLLGKLLVVVMFLIAGKIAQAESRLQILSDPEYGYLLRYPTDWQGRLYRSGVVVADLHNAARDAGIQVRIQDYRGQARVFEQHYVSQFTAEMKALLQTRQERHSDAANVVDLAFKAQRAGRDYVLLNRLMFFADQTRVVVVQAGYPSEKQQVMLAVISDIIDSLWIYRPDKLTAKK